MLLAIAPAVLFQASCGSSNGPNSDVGSDIGWAASSDNSLDATSRPAAIVAGQPLSRNAIFPILTELAGTAALREASLDIVLEDELRRRGLEVTDELIQTERVRLTQGGEAEQAVTREILNRRGLGPTRLARLLRRNASLRLLIEAPSDPTDEAIRVAFEVRYGLKHRVRIALFERAADASAAIDRIRALAETGGLPAAFAEIAGESSIDPSASFGGLLGEISTSDPGLPSTLRRAIDGARTGSMTDIIALDAGFAVALVESRIEAQDIDLEMVRDELAATIRERSARLAMESLAENLLERTEITPIEAGLRWSWGKAR